MRTRMVCLEDGITSCGFRKMAAYVAQLEPGTESFYISTERYRSVKTAVRGMGDKAVIGDEQVDEMAQGLADSDLIGFSSMTGYAELTRRLIKRIREINPGVYMIWGGIHPIIQPEDAILADVNAICTGEGEFAFEEFLAAFKEDRDHTNTKNFWFKPNGHGSGNGNGDQLIKNHFLPLMSPNEMEALPFPQYGAETEKIYLPGPGLREDGRRGLPAQRRPGLHDAVVDRLPVSLRVLRQHEVHRQRQEVQAHPPPQRALHGRPGQGRAGALPAPQPGLLPRRLASWRSPTASSRSSPSCGTTS